MQLLDGKKLAQELKDQLKEEVELIKAKDRKTPKLVNIIIGDDAGSCTYANSQKKVAEYIGIKYELKSLPANCTQEDFCALIQKLNNDKSVNGIMLHKPVPEQIDYSVVANYVDTVKDLEGVNVTNIGKMILGETNIIPCTPASVMEHLKSTGHSLRGLEVVIVGASQIVGKPLSILLLKEMATVTVCHIGTSEAGRLEEHIARADVLVVAVGVPKLIKGEWIKDGAIVVDVGINVIDGKVVGDVDFETAQEKASFITPVPGGVGPLTVVLLMRNGIEAYKMQKEQS